MGVDGMTELGDFQKTLKGPKGARHTQSLAWLGRNVGEVCSLGGQVGDNKTFSDKTEGAWGDGAGVRGGPLSALAGWVQGKLWEGGRDCGKGKKRGGTEQAPDEYRKSRLPVFYLRGTQCTRVLREGRVSGGIRTCTNKGGGGTSVTTTFGSSGSDESGTERSDNRADGKGYAE